ncbi:MAG: sugar ABC transporter permease [Chloroflexi bacterium]|nr:sugar ABC transporter permease [Chloroflexota bacterium]MBU1660178.1 sugar ABC transporter permease [Chloroflexota bacterium]
MSSDATVSKKIFELSVQKKQRQRKELLAAYAFLAPSILIFAVFTFFPAIFSIIASFFRWNLPYDPVFTGLNNYEYLFADNIGKVEFGKSVLNTLYFMLGIPINIGISLWIAVMLNRRLPGVGLFRTAFFLPTLTSMAAISVVWIWLYHPADYGLFNTLLIRFGLPIQAWLRDPLLAMPCLIVMGVWRGMGYNIVIFLAGLQSIPHDLYEASEIDGANWLGQFRQITLPLLSPTTFYILIIGVINSLKAFTEIDVMTQGGPLGATTTLAYYLYQYAFQYFQIGLASAVAVVLFVFILVLTLIQFKVVEKRVHYG